MANARRKGTNKLYETYIAKWIKHCDRRGVHPTKASVPEALNFLQELKDSGVGYSVLNTARSALSCVLDLPFGVTFGSHPDVSKFMKGVFNEKPPLPRYNTIWDVDILLNFLKKWSPARTLAIDKLTYKTIMLILLVSGQRPQILKALRTDNMKIGITQYEFIVENKDLKQGRQNYKPETIVLKKFPPNKQLCVYNYVTEYLKRTLPYRNCRNLVLTVKKPYKAASSDTIARWIRYSLESAGIDTKVFKPASTRAAATSKVRKEGGVYQRYWQLEGGQGSPHSRNIIIKQLRKRGILQRKFYYNNKFQTLVYRES